MEKEKWIPYTHKVLRQHIMGDRRKILAISGSTRKSSANLTLINAIIKLFSDRLRIKVYDGLSDIPHFNPDLDNETPPAEVSYFRSQLRDADGILISTPEYAMGVPGTLKNAIDWTVSSMEFSQKPVALITASTSGQKAHCSLLETLKVIESDIPGSSQLLISAIKTKVKDDQIINQETLEQVKDVIGSLINRIEEKIIQSRQRGASDYS
jgi:NAD(P)H-dependent FMN reductase